MQTPIIQQLQGSRILSLTPNSSLLTNSDPLLSLWSSQCRTGNLRKGHAKVEFRVENDRLVLELVEYRLAGARLESPKIPLLSIYSYPNECVAKRRERKEKWSGSDSNVGPDCIQLTGLEIGPSGLDPQPRKMVRSYYDEQVMSCSRSDHVRIGVCTVSEACLECVCTTYAIRDL